MLEIAASLPLELEKYRLLATSRAVLVLAFSRLMLRSGPCSCDMLLTIWQLQINIILIRDWLFYSSSGVNPAVVKA